MPGPYRPADAIRVFESYEWEVVGVTRHANMRNTENVHASHVAVEEIEVNVPDVLMGELKEAKALA